MNTLTVKFEWEDELGPLWFNVDILKERLITEMRTRPRLLGVEVVEHSYEPRSRPVEGYNMAEPVTWEKGS